jgi:hypothetical protein
MHVADVTAAQAPASAPGVLGQPACVRLLRDVPSAGTMAGATTPTTCGVKTRDVVLAMLVVQTTSIVLLMRYSKTREQAGVPYCATVAVLMAEVLKLPTCIVMAGRTVGFANLRSLLQEEVVGNFGDTIKCAVPAIAFTVQGNLL